MPEKMKKLCAHPGCSEITSTSYCEKHTRKSSSDRYRGSSSSRGYGYKWQQAREAYLKTHSFCVKCLEEGRYISATVVDHIVPHKGDKGLFWDSSNWQPLCKKHHDIKTASEDGGFGNKIVR